MLMDRRDLIINHHLSPSSTMTQLQREHLTYLEVTARKAYSWRLIYLNNKTHVSDFGLVEPVRRLISLLLEVSIWLSGTVFITVFRDII